MDIIEYAINGNLEKIITILSQSKKASPFSEHFMIGTIPR
jgi:hypothetical protein